MKRYTIYSFFGNILSSIEYSLSSQSMLLAFQAENVGLNYLGKDIFGQLGSLVYLVKKSKESDKNPIRFLRHNLIFQQSAILIENIVPLLPKEYQFPLASVCSVGTNISFASLGSINAKCIQTLSKNNDFGENYSILTISNTLGSTIGMGIGIYLGYKFPNPESRLYFLPIISIIRYNLVMKMTKQVSLKTNN